MLVWGPLMGGLMFYFLKKIRREKATVETAFCGFSSQRFLHLFLAGFVTSLLTWLGFVCLVLPGIYLIVAWMFALPLVMDKQLDFWSAMELSRKVVTKHWFKLFGFGLVLLMLVFAGALALFIGVFVMSPLILAALMYAYEDMFGGAAQPAAPPVATGPSGTLVMPAATPPPPRATGGSWTLTTKIGLAAVVLVITVMVLWPLTAHFNPGVRRHSAAGRLIHSIINRSESQEAGQAPTVADAPSPPDTPVEASAPIENTPPAVFGNPTEWTLADLTAINFASGTSTSLPPAVIEMSRGPEHDSAVCAWMENANVDLAFVSAYDGFYGMMRDMATLSRESWEQATPASVAAALHDSGRDVAAKFGDASRLNNPTNYTYCFKTRDGLLGLLQVVGFNENPLGVKIRAKLFQPATNQETSVVSASKDLLATLEARLEAASNINEIREKDKSLAAIASDAARLGQVKIAGQALSQMSETATQSAATRQTALLLAKHGLRKEAVEMAKGISEYSIRDQTLSELAQ